MIVQIHDKTVYCSEVKRMSYPFHDNLLYMYSFQALPITLCRYTFGISSVISLCSVLRLGLFYYMVLWIGMYLHRLLWLGVYDCMNRGIIYTGYYSQGLLLYSCMNRGVSYMGYYSRRVFFLSRGLKTTLSVYIYYIYIYYKACFWPRFAVVLCATNDVKYWNITGSKFRQTSLSLLIRRPTL